MNDRSSDRSLRIIGGKHRGRKVSFADDPGIRPTPNRIRETLFNWLAPHMYDAHCFEPFAGSGILSLEALSRGAGKLTIIDQSSQVIEHIRTQLKIFTSSATDYTLHRGDALAWMQTIEGQKPFDIVFLDPPFAADLASKSCQLLKECQLLAAEALVYIETDYPMEAAALPADWSIHRQKKAASVHYCLCTTG